MSKNTTTVNGKEIPSLELDFGSALPKFDSTLDGGLEFSGVLISKNVYGENLHMYLSKEEIAAMYEYIKGFITS